MYFSSAQGRARARLSLARPASSRSPTASTGSRTMGTSKRAAGAAKARARANFALVKYWGKADARLNVPAVGSISITLDALWSETNVEFDRRLAADELSLTVARGRPSSSRRSPPASICCASARGSRRAPGSRAATTSRPAPGLASSASGFAALVTAGAAALDLELTPRERSVLARRGSGSAARSVFGGFVEMHAGTRPTARQLRRAVARRRGVAARSRDRRHGDRREGGRLEQRHGRARRHRRRTTPPGSPTQPADLAGARRDRSSRLRGARRGRRAQLLSRCTRPRSPRRRRCSTGTARRSNACTPSGACAPGACRSSSRSTPVRRSRRCVLAEARPHVEAALRGVPGVLELLTSRLGPGAELR